MTTRRLSDLIAGGLRSIFSRTGVLILALGLLVVAPWPPAGSYGSIQEFVAAWTSEAPVLPLLPAPTAFYARSTLLEPGVSLARAQLDEQLERLGYRRIETPEPAPGEYFQRGRTLMLHRRAHRGSDGPVDALSVRIDLNSRGRIVRIRDGEDRRIHSVSLEPELIGKHFAPHQREQRRIALEDAPEHLVRAVLVAEDQRFFEHRGLDLRRIGGAFLANLRAGQVVQGGSTITQQLVKNVFLSRERTWLRKLREARIARSIESQLSKSEILEAYLNEVYLGQQGAVGIHGMGAAAWHYFSQPVAELSLADSALLAGLIRGPNLYRPFRTPERALARRNQVLDDMLAVGEIDPEVHAAETARKLELRRGALRLTDAGYFMDVLQPALRGHVEADELETGSLTVHTSLDARLQRLATRSIAEGLSALERAYPRLRDADAPVQAAVVALDAETGAVRALVGGRSYTRYPFNRAVSARRQPGSAFKPIASLAAVARNGNVYPTHTLASVLEDMPLELETDEAEPWMPENHDREFRGEVTLRTALEQSLNVPMTRLALDVGPMQVVRAARRLGIRSKLRPVPSIALGTYEVTPLELTRAYATLAAGGRRPEIHPVDSVFDAAHDLRLRVKPGSKRVYAADEAYLITSALRGVVQRGTGQRVAAAGVPVAGKTGTTNDYRDGWFVGYTSELVVGVWVGFDDGRSLGLSGSRTGAPLFARFVKKAHVGPTPAEFRAPRGMQHADVDPESGLLADSFCTGSPEVFLDGTSPTETCAGGFWSRRSAGRLFKEYPSDHDDPEHANVRARALAMEDFFNRTRSALKRRR